MTMHTNNAEKIHNLIYQHKKIIIFIFLCSLYIPFISLPPYYDDEVRFTTNFIGLLEQGRIIPEFFYKFITSKNVADTYIFNLAFSVAISLFLLKIEYIKKNYILFIILFSNIFLLGNLSYHVDIIGMMLAYTLGIYAAFYEHKNIKKMILISFLISYLAIISYQAALNIFSTCLIAVTILDFVTKKHQLKRNFYIRLTHFFFLIISIKITLISINAILKLNNNYQYTYINKRSQLELSSFDTQLYIALEFIRTSFNTTQFILLSVFILITLIVILLFKTNSKNKIILLAAIPISFFLMFFPYIFINEKSLIQPRVIFGFGGFILTTYILSFYFTNNKSIQNFINLTYLIFSIIFLCTASAYVSSYKKSIEIEVQLYQKIDFTINPQSKPINMYRCGKNYQILNSKYIKTNANAFPIINHLLQQQKTGWILRSQAIYDLYDLNFTAKKCIQPIPDEKEIIIQNKYYNFYKIDHQNYLVFYKTPI